MKEEQARMKSLIVESPERHKSKMKSMNETLHRLKQARQETSDKCDHYRDRVSLASRWQSDVQGFCKKLQYIETNMETHSKILEEIKHEEEQVVNGNMELKSLSNEEAQLKRTVYLKKEKLAKLEIKNTKQQEDFEKQKQEILDVCSHTQEKRQAVHGRLVQVTKEIHQKRTERDQLRAIMASDEKKYQEVVVDIKSALEKYHETLTKASAHSAAQRREKIAGLNHRLSQL
ncbi:hypothetical protein FKM82_021580 [Ascaphus truei]